jgi:hypothetical protein
MGSKEGEPHREHDRQIDCNPLAGSPEVRRDQGARRHRRGVDKDQNRHAQEPPEGVKPKELPRRFPQTALRPIENTSERQYTIRTEAGLPFLYQPTRDYNPPQKPQAPSMLCR